MKLQNLVFPKAGICEEKELYFHFTGTVQQKEDVLFLEPATQVDFFTYFNSFSMGKWNEYTSVDQVDAVLECQGRGRVRLWMAALSGDQLEKKLLADHRIVAEEQKEFSFPFERQDRECVYYIDVTAEDQLKIFGGGYHAPNAKKQRPINIAIGICTYRREAFVQKTLQTLRDAILENDSSPLRHHIRVYVSDNGNTLPLDEYPQGNPKVVYNKNAGGSGGFGRCMLEALKDQEKYGLTHMLLMDDDIILEPESIYRTYIFLLLQKKEFTDHILAGGLLRLDIPYIQHANGETWNMGKIGFTKRGYDLRNEKMVLKNEHRLPIEYGGWWYCCIPMTGKEYAMPLPLFIHADDIEYGLRYGGKILTLNGIGVWHDAFDNRRSSSMEYYDMRNGLICNIVYCAQFRKKNMIKMVCQHLIGQLLRCRYEDQLLTMKAVEDYLKGPDFLKQTDPVLLNQQVAQMGYRQEDVGVFLDKCDVNLSNYLPSAEKLYLRIPFSLKQKLTLNGWLLPGQRELTPILFGADFPEFYRRKNILLFDPETKKGIFVRREWKQLFVTLGRCLRMTWLIYRKYPKAAMEYRNALGELTSPAFWKRYLDV